MKTSTWLWINKTFRRGAVQLEKVMFSNDDPQPRKVLFLFPQGKERFLDSIPVIEELERYQDEGTIQLAIPDPMREFTPPTRHKVFFYPVLKGTPPRVDLPVLEVRYQHETFDAVINLDPVLDRRLMRILRVITVPKRIGFAGPGSDDIYNIQIDPGEPESLAGSYTQIMALCDLGKPATEPNQPA